MSGDLEFGEIRVGTAEYDSELEMRHRILREPLGIEWTDDERAWEKTERHFGMVVGGKVVACVLARDLGEGAMKLRQMAVEPERQNSGVGKNLLEKVEDVLRGKGTTRFELNARDLAVGFYEKLGYEKVGEEFVEVGIAHWKMRKDVVVD